LTKNEKYSKILRKVKTREAIIEMLNAGMELTKIKVVGKADTAVVVGSGGLDVFSTPMMIAFMENTAFELAQKELNSGETTVGTSVNIKHLRANLIDDEVQCKAVLTSVVGKKLSYTVDVTYKDELVGTGDHVRYIVDEKKFFENIKK